MLGAVQYDCTAPEQMSPVMQPFPQNSLVKHVQQSADQRQLLCLAIRCVDDSNNHQRQACQRQQCGENSAQNRDLPQNGAGDAHNNVRQEQDKSLVCVIFGIAGLSAVYQQRQG